MHKRIALNLVRLALALPDLPNSDSNWVATPELSTVWQRSFSISTLLATPPKFIAKKTKPEKDSYT